MQQLKKIFWIPSQIKQNKGKTTALLIFGISLIVYVINRSKNNKSKSSINPSNQKSEVDPNNSNPPIQSEIIHQSPQDSQAQIEQICPNQQNLEQMQLSNIQYTFENSNIIQSKETAAPSELKVTQISKLLEKIYNKTCKARDVKEEFRFFVSDLKDEEYLIEEYGSKNDKLSQTLRDNLNGMRRSRGDGNCFYTSFGYQFLQYYILHNSDHEFDYLIDLINQQEFQVTLEDISATQEEGQQMKELLLQYWKQIREQNINDRKEQFHTLFSNPDGQFYGLSIIFLRNLAYNICNQDEETKVLFEALELDLKKQLIEWEFDCENNQVVIAQLAANLKIKITIYYIESDTYQLNIQKYSPNQNNDEHKFQIHILFRPGHYNIAIPK